MNKSESIAALAASLSKAQGQIKGAVKDSANPFFKSRYADLASVVEAIRAAFSANGLSYLQITEPSERDEVRVETVILHSSGEWISCGTFAVPVTKSDAQGYGSALTYCRRYSLALVGVAPEDDDGNAASIAAPKPASAKSVTQDEWEQCDADTQKWLQGIVDCVRAELESKGADSARALLEEQGLSAEHKTALWSRLDSKERSAIKSAAKRGAGAIA